MTNTLRAATALFRGASLLQFLRRNHPSVQGDQPQGPIPFIAKWDSCQGHPAPLDVFAGRVI